MRTNQRFAGPHHGRTYQLIDYKRQRTRTRTRQRLRNAFRALDWPIVALLALWLAVALAAFER